MESSLAPYRQRKGYFGQRGEVPGVLPDGRAQMNDLLELRDSQLWLHGVPMVDVKAPKDDIMYPETLVPPQLNERLGPAGVRKLREELANPDLVTRMIATQRLRLLGELGKDVAPVPGQILRTTE